MESARGDTVGGVRIVLPVGIRGRAGLFRDIYILYIQYILYILYICRFERTENHKKGGQGRFSECDDGVEFNRRVCIGRRDARCPGAFVCCGCERRYRAGSRTLIQKKDVESAIRQYK